MAKRASVTDHRVRGLSCQKVTPNSVARALREDAFGPDRHLSYQNWAFRYGAYNLANCWSLSRFQRLYFYLREPAAATTLSEFSNQARSHDMYEDEQGWKGFPLKTFWFMPDASDSLWRMWERGWTQSGPYSAGLERGLETDVEYYQALRFHQIDNLRLLKGPLARTGPENQATWSELANLIATGRRPLLVLRPDPYLQHVVIAKKIELTSSGARIWVYDSNAPWLDRSVVWDQASSMFSAYDVVSGLAIANPAAPIGVFIVDQEENEKILISLASHYTQVCNH